MNYVGIDIHKRYSVLVAVDERGRANGALPARSWAGQPASRPHGSRKERLISANNSKLTSPGGKRFTVNSSVSAQFTLCIRMSKVSIKARSSCRSTPYSTASDCARPTES